MGEQTNIAWTDHTWNAWWGCARVSEGCQHCYAETWAKRTGHDVWGVNGDRRTFGAKHWNEPVRWNRAAEAAGRRESVFCSSMADVFEDHPTARQEREKIWPLIEATPWLDWQLLTKRPELVNEAVPQRWLDGWPDNVWIGTTAENQRRFDERIGWLVSIPARVRFISFEPLLGPINCGSLLGVDWAIIGGESGPHCRPMDLQWARDLIAQARHEGVAPFFKQTGGFPNARNIHTLDGQTIQEFPVERVDETDARGRIPSNRSSVLRVDWLPEPDYMAEEAEHDRD